MYIHMCMCILVCLYHGCGIKIHVSSSCSTVSAQGFEYNDLYITAHLQLPECKLYSVHVHCTCSFLLYLHIRTCIYTIIYIHVYTHTHHRHAHTCAMLVLLDSFNGCIVKCYVHVHVYECTTPCTLYWNLTCH